MLALATQDLDGSERFGLRTHPHVKILSKFEVLGPRNGRGATWQNASLVKVVFLRFGAVIRRRASVGPGGPFTGAKALYEKL